MKLGVIYNVKVYGKGRFLCIKFVIIEKFCKSEYFWFYFKDIFVKMLNEDIDIVYVLEYMVWIYIFYN